MISKPTFDKKRPLSWSAISSFEWDKEQWYKKYVKGEKERDTPELIFGKKVGERLASDPTYLPFVPRLSTFEFEFKTSWGKIPLIGYGDAFDEATNRALKEYKTGVKIWNQERADNHGQIDMYCLKNWKMHKVRPEEVDIELVWLPTKKTLKKDLSYTIDFVDDIEKNFKIFKTKRTMHQILKFGARIERVYKEMLLYCKNHG